MISAPKVGYVLGVLFTIINVLLTLAFSPEETKNKALKEYPKELIGILDSHKNDDEKFIYGDEYEKLKKSEEYDNDN
jgi:hypothetical protein